MVPSWILAASAVAVASSPWKLSTCTQPLVGGQNISFESAIAFAQPGSPAVLLSMATLNNGTGASPHLSTVLPLDIVWDPTGVASCSWSSTTAALSVARTSGCATTFGETVIFAGGHDNAANYVGPVDVFARPKTGGVVRAAVHQLPVGRELLGCVSNGNVTIFAGGKPPHPPAPFGETKEIDLWHHDTGTWTQANLSVERKKVEAVALGDLILMAGGEIGHHPPVSPPRPGPPAAPVGGYSSSVDVLNVKTGKMSTAALALARQYFAVAVAGGKAFFAGGFANDPTAARKLSPGMPFAGFRSNLVDVYDSASDKWSIMHLSTNRSNLMGTSVMDRFVLFGGGTRQEATPDLCGTAERSAVIDIYDTQTATWSTACMSEGRTSLDSAAVGPTAIFFGGPGDPIELLTFDDAGLVSA